MLEITGIGLGEAYNFKTLDRSASEELSLENPADTLEEKAVLAAGAKVLLLEDQITTRKISLQ